MLKLSDNVTVDEPEPEFKYSATMHGDEPVGTEMCIYLIRLLVENYGTDPELTALVDDLEIWICPLHNPDGLEHGTRYNANGYDLNRTFPDPVDDPYDDPTGRPREVQLMMYFQYAHNVILGANFHTGALVVNYPWDSMYGEYTEDHDMIHNLSLGYSVLNPPMWNSPEFPNGVTIGWAWYVIHGGMQDWCYYWRNEINLTIELSNTKWPHYSQLDDFWDDNRDAMLAYLGQARIGVEGFVTDAVDQTPIKATIAVAEIDKDMWGEPLEGYYHRLLEPGSYTLTFSGLGYEPHTEYGVVVAGGVTTQLDVQLARSAWHTVSGTVTAAEGGAPLTAQVAAHRHDTGELIRTAATDPGTGAYLLELPAWEYDLVATAEGYVTQTETRTVNTNLDVDFQLVRSRGSVLLVLDNNPNPTMRTDLPALGYLVTEETEATTEPATWGDYDLLIWSAGQASDPVSVASLRAALEAHVAAERGLLIEGGEIGYDALENPGYPSFAAGVLHASEWLADGAGELEMASGQEDHDLVTTPNALPATIEIDYNHFGDLDALNALPAADVIYGTTLHPAAAGLLVRDLPGRAAGQIVYYAFDYAALADPLVAKRLLENTLTYIIPSTQEAPELADDLRLHLAAPRPSVTRGSANLQLALPVAGDVQVGIYDATGRRVRTLLSAELDAGIHLLVWDGRDERGREAAAGVYFLRATTPAGARSRRIVVVE
jgi:hypothetical protein